MQGISQTFELEDQTWALKRPEFDEMPGYVDRINAGETMSVLQDACDADGFAEALRTARPGAVGRLWHDYLSFFDYEEYMKLFWEPQQAMMTRVDALIRSSLEAQGLGTGSASGT